MDTCAHSETCNARGNDWKRSDITTRCPKSQIKRSERFHMPTNDKTNQPPTPAAVRAAIRYSRGFDDCLTADEQHALSHEERVTDEILADHIRAITAEMRAESIAMHVNTHDPFVEPGTREAEITAAKLLAVFADKLEGKQ